VERGAIEYRNYRTAMRIADAKRMIQSYAGFADQHQDDSEAVAWYENAIEIERAVLRYLTTNQED